MSEFKIEKGVPIPASNRTCGVSMKAILGSMEIGDSTVIPIGKRTAISDIGLRLGMEFLSRKAECEEGFVRVWRVR